MGFALQKIRPALAGNPISARLNRARVTEGEMRTRAQLREHYLVERELAGRLRYAPRQRRGTLYREVYNELFRRVPHHPQLQRTEPARRLREVERLARLLRRFLKPATVFMEVGAGDCALSIRVAAAVKQVYAVDVSEQITHGVRPPANFSLLLSDGCSIPVPEGSVHVAFSNQLMEHLHPEDAYQQLQNIHRSLAPGGSYVCITPNRLYGPHDISGYFDNVAKGFHLHEYTAAEMRRLFAAAGFSRPRFYACVRGSILRMPYWPLALAESVLESLPRGLRQRIGDTGPLRALLGVLVVAVKPRP
jgi:SAM-dependent methyltransferase